MGHILQNWEEKSIVTSRSFASAEPTGSLLFDPRGNRKYLTVAERKAFLIAAMRLPLKARTFCLLLAYSGCRISEVLSLTARRFDVGAQVVVVESLKKRRRGLFRAVPLPASLLDELDKIHRVSEMQKDLAARDQPLWEFGRTTAWMHVKSAMVAAGICGTRSSPKGLRHSFGVTALQAGVPLNLVKKWLGHSRISTTAIYADAVGDEERSLAARLWGTF